MIIKTIEGTPVNFDDDMVRSFLIDSLGYSLEDLEGVRGADLLDFLTQEDMPYLEGWCLA